MKPFIIIAVLSMALMITGAVITFTIPIIVVALIIGFIAFLLKK